MFEIGIQTFSGLFDSCLTQFCYVVAHLSLSRSLISIIICIFSIQYVFMFYFSTNYCLQLQLTLWFLTSLSILYHILKGFSLCDMLIYYFCAICVNHFLTRNKLAKPLRNQLQIGNHFFSNELIVWFEIFSFYISVKISLIYFQWSERD